MVWHEHPFGTLSIPTAWAIIALMEADYPDITPIRRGIQLLMDRQLPNGEWPYEAIEGVFNKSCMITYLNYKFIFPMKALGMFATKYPNEVVVAGISTEDDA
jgi:lanosterol synthase